MELFNFRGKDGATTTTKYFDMTTLIFFQEVFHVFKKLHMPALVTGNRYCLCIFFNRGFYNFLHRTVMAQVDDLRSFALHDAAHNINSGVMPVKQACSGHYPDRGSDFRTCIFTHKGVISKISKKLMLVSGNN